MIISFDNFIMGLPCMFPCYGGSRYGEGRSRGGSTPSYLFPFYGRIRAAYRYHKECVLDLVGNMRRRSRLQPVKVSRECWKRTDAAGIAPGGNE